MMTILTKMAIQIIFEYYNHTNPTQADISGLHLGYQLSSDKNDHKPYHIISAKPARPRASIGECFKIDIM